MRKITTFWSFFLTGISTLFYYLFYINGYNAETGLVESYTCLWFSFLFAAGAVVGWVKVSKGATVPKEKSVALQPVWKPDEMQTALYCAVLLLWLLMVMFLVIFAISTKVMVAYLLLLLAVFSFWGLLRYGMIRVFSMVRKSDSFFLVMPLFYLSVFSMKNYADRMCLPNISVYSPEIISMAFMLISASCIIGHFFGKKPGRRTVLICLSSMSFSAITYIVGMLRFTVNREILTMSGGELYFYIIRLLVFASMSVMSGIYAWKTLQEATLLTTVSTSEEDEEDGKQDQ